jgi:hypothetical protein
MIDTLPRTEEHITEPLPAVRAHSSGECGVDGRNRSASLMRCVVCGLTLCERHAYMRWLDNKNRALCPEHKGGKQ